MPLYLKMSENINKTTRHLKFRYISILTNLLRNLFTNLLQIFFYIYLHLPPSINHLKITLKVLLKQKSKHFIVKSLP